MSILSTQPVAREDVTPSQDAFVPTYMVAAVLSTVFCFVPTGVAAVVYAGQVRTLLALGQVAAARRASRTAKRLCWVSLAVTLTFLAVIIVGADGYTRNH
jgi:hypothetical protein